MNKIMCILSICIMAVGPGCGENDLGSGVTVTHGPILGRLSHDGIGVWVRTSTPAVFSVQCTSPSGAVHTVSGNTELDHDNTGWVHITGLDPDSQYSYDIETPDSGFRMDGGTFRTLPHEDQFQIPDLNPRGLFNFSFEYGCGNMQNETHPIGTAMRTYKTMYDQLKDEIHFQIMNGDWLYEDVRVTPPEKWMRDNQVSEADVPDVVGIVPTIVGVWENYKRYLTRSENLAKWHRYIPTFFVFDDHEMTNDVGGTATPGVRDRRTAFRDIGIQAWYDYLGWSNPLPDPEPQEILFGTAELTAGSDILYDATADFTSLDLGKATTIIVPWDEPDAGIWDDEWITEGGHPNAGVYGITEVIDRNRLKIFPEPVADGKSVPYSIGRDNHYRFRVSNCDFFVLDTRGNRGLHDTRNPTKKGLSMLGKRQKAWLMDGMRDSDADFLFVVSSVNMTIPHTGGGYGTVIGKDEAWTVFIDEREQLIEFWDALDQPVMVLTGDLHNSLAIKITDNVWEFASGPHNSMNHPMTSESNRPPSGDFEYNGRNVNIRWSTYFHDDISRDNRVYPHYCVVQVNNVFNNPLELGGERWLSFPQPQVIFKFYDGLTGELKYAESIAAHGK
jgi:alkaline phosphatase D